MLRYYLLPTFLNVGSSSLFLRENAQLLITQFPLITNKLPGLGELIIDIIRSDCREANAGAE